MPRTDISVLIVSKGRSRERFIKMLLHSLLEQTIRPREVIIVCRIIPKVKFTEYIVVYGVPVKVISCDCSRTSAINIGLRIASSNYVLITDDDIVFERRFFEKMNSAIKSTSRMLDKVVMILPRIKWPLTINVYGKLIGSTNKWARHVIRLLEQILIRKIYGKVSIALNTWCCLVNRKLFLEKLRVVDSNFEEPVLGEDLEISIRAWKSGLRMVRLPTIAVIHFSAIALRRHLTLLKEPSLAKYLYKCFTYYVTKHSAYLGFVPSLLFVTIRCIKEAIFYTVSTKKLSIMLYTVMGFIEGLVQGVRASLTQK